MMYKYGFSDGLSWIFGTTIGASIFYFLCMALYRITPNLATPAFSSYFCFIVIIMALGIDAWFLLERIIDLINSIADYRHFGQLLTFGLIFTILSFVMFWIVPSHESALGITDMIAGAVFFFMGAISIFASEKARRC